VEFTRASFIFAGMEKKVTLPFSMQPALSGGWQ
jgi:hypothetical protein